MGRIDLLAATARWAIAIGLLVATVGLAVACSAPPSTAPSATDASEPPVSRAPFTLTVYNIDGPAADVQINGKVVGHLACQVVSDTYLVAVDPASMPPLPWTVDLVRSDAKLIATFHETGVDGPRTIVLRASGAYEDATGAPVGPAPAATCSP